MTEQENVQESEQVEEVKEPTIEERIEKYRDNIKEFQAYIQFTKDVVKHEKGDVFTFKESYCEVVKKTKSGHMDVDIYKLEIDEEGNESKGKWQQKQRVTPESLDLGARHAKNTIFRIEHEIKKLEKEIEANAPIAEEGEDIEKS